ncbi:hypothetical protein GQ53DRAFT_818191 [Thozetella sp. PMI_491]|nr:hypothetical protein GQ53DRAFT_818191 [Thozetella sp. PMI_491]
MPFQFIDNSSEIGPAARRRIRSHAATGKNLGRTIVRPSRKKAVIVKPRYGPPPSQLPPKAQDLSPTIERQIGDGLSVLLLPANLSRDPSVVQRGIAFFCRMHYTPELYKAFAPHQGPPTMWFQLTFQDEAYFHIVIATTIISLNTITAEKEDPELAVRHVTQALRLVNQRLSQADALSDASMAVVVMMAQYERHLERYFKGLVHLEGIHRMVQMRGGIAELTRSKPTLGQKIARLDLDYTLYLGTVTRFTLTEVEEGIAPWSWFRDGFRADYEQKPTSLSLFNQLPAELRELAIDLTCLARLLNDANAGRRPVLDTRAFHATLLLLGYRLVAFSPLGRPRPTCPLENAVHLGLVAFVMPFMHRFDGKIPNSPLLSRLIQSASQEDFSMDKGAQEVLLWFLLVTEASVGMQSNDEWLAPMITQVMQNLGLHTWEDVTRTMARYPWIDAFHAKRGQALPEGLSLGGPLSVATTLLREPVTPREDELLVD